VLAGGWRWSAGSCSVIGIDIMLHVGIIATHAAVLVVVGVVRPAGKHYVSRHELWRTVVTVVVAYQ